jgi:D-alanine-D-alanine ligase
MRKRIAVVYNEPEPSKYDKAHEEKAVAGVLESVTAVREALNELGYETSLLPLVPPFDEAAKKLADLKVDVVFNLFEGFCGLPETEALVPETLAELGVPYTGCGPEVLRLALDKARVKEILKEAGIPTPDYQILDPGSLHNFRLKFPCIVKPRAEDASHGITTKSLVRDYAELKRQVTEVCQIYKSVLVEHFVGGREFNATVMGNSRCVVLPVSEIAYDLPSDMPRILTFAAKWEIKSRYYKGTKVVCPARVSESEHEHITGIARDTYRLLVKRGYARVDMRMDETGKLNVIEINPNPDISPEAGAARQSAAAGMNYAQFIQRILKLAVIRGKNGRKNPPDVPGRQTGINADTREYARI